MYKNNADRSHNNNQNHNNIVEHLYVVVSCFWTLITKLVSFENPLYRAMLHWPS